MYYTYIHTYFYQQSVLSNSGTISAAEFFINNNPDLIRRYMYVCMNVGRSCRCFEVAATRRSSRRLRWSAIHGAIWYIHTYIGLHTYIHTYIHTYTYSMCIHLHTLFNNLYICISNISYTHINIHTVHTVHTY